MTVHREPRAVTRGESIVLYRRIATVVEPLASQYAGQPASVTRPLLRSAWRRAFNAELREPVLSRCAAAIHDRTPWSWAFWV
ncbi:MAG TPA: hypothetical protein VGH89_27500 [Pseudonocardia sp.]